MYLRDLVKDLWAQAGLYERKDAQLRSFLKAVDSSPLECWDELSGRFRRDYYELFDQLIPPLMASRDKLLRVMLIRLGDLEQPKELALAIDLVRHADPVADRPELNALLHQRHPRVEAEIRKRPGMLAIIDPPVPKNRIVTNVVRKPVEPAPDAPDKEPTVPARAGKKRG